MNSPQQTRVSSSPPDSPVASCSKTAHETPEKHNDHNYNATFIKIEVDPESIIDLNVSIKEEPMSETEGLAETPQTKVKRGRGRPKGSGKLGCQPRRKQRGRPRVPIDLLLPACKSENPKIQAYQKMRRQNNIASRKHRRKVAEARKNVQKEIRELEARNVMLKRTVEILATKVALRRRELEAAGIYVEIFESPMNELSVSTGNGSDGHDGHDGPSQQ